MNRNQAGSGVLQALAVLTAASLASGALALQDEGPIVIGTEEELKFFGIEDLRIAIDMFGRRKIDEVKPRDGQKTKDTEDLLRGTLEITSDAFIGHPNLIKLDLGFKLRLSQEYFDSESNQINEESLENINEWDVSATILQKGKAPLTLYTRRSQSLVDRQFGNSLDSTITEYGARLSLRSDTIPTTFTVFHREQDQSSRLGNLDFNLTQDTFEWQSRFTSGTGHFLTWDYSYDQVDEAGQLRRTNAFERHDALLTHNYEFGEDRKHDLRSTLRYYEETGDFPLEQFRWDESLRLRHTPKFETRYDYTLDQQTTLDSKQTLNRGAVGFRHQLFDSLTTSAQVGASLLDVERNDFQSEQHFGDIDLEYHKRVPLGRFTASAAAIYNWQDDSESGAAIQFIDQRLVFGTSGVVTLSRRNIDLNSIRITDGTGLILYSEGADYTLREFADRVEIRRVLGGDIADGDEVLVDFVVGREPGSTTTTLGLGGTLRYDFDEGWLRGLGVYTRYFDQSQERDTDSLVVLPVADIQDFIYGADYSFWHITLKAERQMRDSTLAPYEATRLEGRYIERLGRGSSLVVSANYNEVDNTDDDIQTTVIVVTGRWNQRVTDRLSASLVAIWRDEQDSVGVDTQGFEQRLDLTWRYRQTTVYASLQNAIVQSDVNDRLSQSFLLGVRREF